MNKRSVEVLFQQYCVVFSKLDAFVPLEDLRVILEYRHATLNVSDKYLSFSAALAVSLAGDDSYR